MKTTKSPDDDNITYAQLIIWYDVVPNSFFLRAWKKYGKRFPNKFKVSYYFDSGFSHMCELYFIESTLFTRIIKREKI